jgi:hypothetical protein
MRRLTRPAHARRDPRRLRGRLGRSCARVIGHCPRNGSTVLSAFVGDVGRSLWRPRERRRDSGQQSRLDQVHSARSSRVHSSMGPGTQKCTQSPAAPLRAGMCPPGRRAVCGCTLRKLRLRALVRAATSPFCRAISFLYGHGYGHTPQRAHASEKSACHAQLGPCTGGASRCGQCMSQCDLGDLVPVEATCSIQCTCTRE